MKMQLENNTLGVGGFHSWINFSTHFTLLDKSLTNENTPFLRIWPNFTNPSIILGPRHN